MAEPPYPVKGQSSPQTGDDDLEADDESTVDSKTTKDKAQLPSEETEITEPAVELVASAEEAVEVSELDAPIVQEMITRPESVGSIETESVTPLEVEIPEEAVLTAEPPREVQDEAVGSSGFILSPEAQREGQLRMVTVVMRSSGDKARDNLRIRRIYGTFISYPGNDRFAFYVLEGKRGYLLEFPNDTTGYCKELHSHLVTIAGVENVRVEPITFQ
jgi:hypothetical protein